MKSFFGLPPSSKRILAKRQSSRPVRLIVRKKPRKQEKERALTGNYFIDTEGVQGRPEESSGNYFIDTESDQNRIAESSGNYFVEAAKDRDEVWFAPRTSLARRKPTGDGISGRRILNMLSRAARAMASADPGGYSYPTFRGYPPPLSLRPADIDHSRFAPNLSYSYTPPGSSGGSCRTDPEVTCLD